VKQQQIEQAWQGAERCKNCAIRHLVIFADLEQSDFDRIHLPVDDLAFAPGEALYQQAQDTPFVYTLRSGLIKLVQLRENGDQRIVRLLKQGDLAGLETLSGGSTRHAAIALNHVRVCRIPRSVIARLCVDSPNLHNRLMQQWQRALENADDWISQLSTGPSKRRVAQLLLLLDQHSEDSCFFLPTREDMGAMLGITTESSSKAIAEFRRQEWLKPLTQNRAWIDRSALAQQFS